MRAKQLWTFLNLDLINDSFAADLRKVMVDERPDTSHPESAGVVPVHPEQTERPKRAEIRMKNEGLRMKQKQKQHPASAIRYPERSEARVIPLAEATTWQEALAANGHPNVQNLKGRFRYSRFRNYKWLHLFGASSYLDYPEVARAVLKHKANAVVAIHAGTLSTYHVLADLEAKGFEGIVICYTGDDLGKYFKWGREVMPVLSASNRFWAIFASHMNGGFLASIDEINSASAGRSEVRQPHQDPVLNLAAPRSKTGSLKGSMAVRAETRVMPLAEAETIEEAIRWNDLTKKIVVWDQPERIQRGRDFFRENADVIQGSADFDEIEKAALDLGPRCIFMAHESVGGMVAAEYLLERSYQGLIVIYSGAGMDVLRKHAEPYPKTMEAVRTHQVWLVRYTNSGVSPEFLQEVRRFNQKVNHSESRVIPLAEAESFEEAVTADGQPKEIFVIDASEAIARHQLDVSRAERDQFPWLHLYGWKDIYHFDFAETQKKQGFDKEFLTKVTGLGSRAVVLIHQKTNAAMTIKELLESGFKGIVGVYSGGSLDQVSTIFWDLFPDLRAAGRLWIISDFDARRHFLDSMDHFNRTGSRSESRTTLYTPGVYKGARSETRTIPLAEAENYWEAVFSGQEPKEAFFFEVSRSARMGLFPLYARHSDVDVKNCPWIHQSSFGETFEAGENAAGKAFLESVLSAGPRARFFIHYAARPDVVLGLLFKTGFRGIVVVYSGGEKEKIEQKLRERFPGQFKEKRIWVADIPRELSHLIESMDEFNRQAAARSEIRTTSSRPGLESGASEGKDRVFKGLPLAEAETIEEALAATPWPKEAFIYDTPVSISQEFGKEIANYPWLTPSRETDTIFSAEDKFWDQVLAAGAHGILFIHKRMNAYAAAYSLLDRGYKGLVVIYTGGVPEVLREDMRRNQPQLRDSHQVWFDHVFSVKARFSFIDKIHREHAASQPRKPGRTSKSQRRRSPAGGEAPRPTKGGRAEARGIPGLLSQVVRHEETFIPLERAKEEDYSRVYHEIQRILFEPLLDQSSRWILNCLEYNFRGEKFPSASFKENTAWKEELIRLPEALRTKLLEFFEAVRAELYYPLWPVAYDSKAVQYLLYFYQGLAPFLKEKVPVPLAASEKRGQAPFSGKVKKEPDPAKPALPLAVMVDDNAPRRATTKIDLDHTGKFESATIASSQIGVRFLRKRAPDLLILDVMFPEDSSAREVLAAAIESARREEKQFDLAVIGGAGKDEYSVQELLSFAAANHPNVVRSYQFADSPVTDWIAEKSKNFKALATEPEVRSIHTDAAKGAEERSELRAEVGRIIAPVRAETRAVPLSPVAVVKGVGHQQIKPWQILRLNQDVIVVLEQARIDTLSPEMFKELLEIAGLNHGKLHLVIPDALHGKYSERVTELRKVASVYYGFPRLAASEKVPVIGFSDMEHDTLAAFQRRLDPKLVARMKDSAFGLNRAGSFGVGILYALKDISPEQLLPNQNGFRYDRSGFYSAQVLEVLQAYTVISTSA